MPRFLICLLGVLAGLGAGEAAKLEIRPLPDNAGLAVHRIGQDRPLLVQHARPDFRPYIHPINAPDGKGVFTEDAPGHHKWQHGLYTGMHGVNGEEFWNFDDVFHPKPAMPGAIDGNRASWTVDNEWRGRKSGKPILNEVQRWTLTDQGDHYLLDFAWTITAIVDTTFSKGGYGGPFLRMPYRKEGDALTSEGAKRGAAEGKPARWVAITMPIEGRDDWGSIAFMEHKSTPNHPLPWRVDNQLGLGPARCRLGDWRLKAGESMPGRYRLLIHGGKPDAARIEAAWSAFNS